MTVHRCGLNRKVNNLLNWCYLFIHCTLAISELTTTTHKDRTSHSKLPSVKNPQSISIIQITGLELYPEGVGRAAVPGPPDWPAALAMRDSGCSAALRGAFVFCSRCWQLVWHRDADDSDRSEVDVHRDALTGTRKRVSWTTWLRLSRVSLTSVCSSVARC